MYISGKTGNKSDCMKMYKYEKTQSSEDGFIWGWAMHLTERKSNPTSYLLVLIQLS